MKMTKEKFKTAIREEIIEILSGGDDSMTDQIYTLISRANLSDDAKEVMMKWMEHTDNPQAIIDYLESQEGMMNEETRSVGSMVRPEGFEVGDKVKYKGMNHEITRIIDDRIYIKNLKYGGRPDTWVKAVDLKKSMKEATIEVKPEDLDKVKSKAKPEDTIRIVKEIDEDEIDKKAIKNASSGKKDSIISMANQLVKVAMEMKSLAKEYKSAKEGKETEKEKEILSKLKELTAQKRKLEAKLS
jgi:hypothetical protein